MTPETPYYHEQYAAPQRQPLFCGGNESVSTSAQELCDRIQTTPAHYFTRHYSGDWGDMTSEVGARYNRQNIILGREIRSAYRISDTESLRVTTLDGHQDTVIFTKPIELIDVVVDVIERGNRE